MARCSVVRLTRALALSPARSPVLAPSLDGCKDTQTL
jgi:hypothetical protein